MNDTVMLYPVIALALWTQAVLGLLPIQRFRAYFRGQVEVDDFKFGESARVPAKVSIPNRNYMNLLELPLLFYVVCVCFYVTHHGEPLVLAGAWTYVSLRVLHSLVHLSYNKVTHRLSVFALSNLVLLALWLRLWWRLSV